MAWSIAPLVASRATPVGMEIGVIDDDDAVDGKRTPRKEQEENSHPQNQTENIASNEKRGEKRNALDVRALREGRKKELCIETQQRHLFTMG